MASSGTPALAENRKPLSSPRPRRENAKNTLCRHVTIYGHCRYEKSCDYVHDPSKLMNTQAMTDRMKNRLNVDSPSFVPLQPASPNGASAPRNTAISPKAADAAIFTPKSANATIATVSPPQAQHSKEPSQEWNAQAFQDFVPQASYDGGHSTDQSGSGSYAFDPFSVPPNIPGIQEPSQAAPPPMNMYTPQETTAMGSNSYFHNGAFAQPLQYHLYAPMAPHRENVLAYQRTAHDFFMPDPEREDLQRKAEATLQVLPNSTLPQRIDHFHSLVPLDTSNQKNLNLFGYQTWLYKAVSSKDGNTYAMRRLEGYRLTNEKAIRAVQAWRRIDNAGVVSVHDAFTSRSFGDSSLIFVTDYHPLSKTLAEHHFQFPPRFAGRQVPTPVPEQTIWGYIVQIGSALKAIHSSGLAAQVIHTTKVILTSKNRIRLSGCGIMDVVQHDSSRPLHELQADDLIHLGRLVLCIASNNPNALLNVQKAIETITRNYSERMKECIAWLLTPNPPPGAAPSPTGQQIVKDIDVFLTAITTQMVSVLDSSLHAEDTLTSMLARELENGRLARLMAKLTSINERPEHAHDARWSETGERYYLKLFRDYVFHQVDASGNPVVDLAHIVSCLNKLDAGVDEKVALVSRDEQNVLLVSYREVKRAVDSAFTELIKNSRRG
ncbi:hypothetical protein P152DRAFT_398929 [Eremomyces bilateralis CBS 781.70]|uniref:PAN2-PAN3 deadenylation complex subunit PAN3 n=1 Tax=Eremomyces bilateralis CBS 781.70 TaxID=1392243 RepID=A0A6G1G0I5_9PEZI|nr:uncharacterized protein P152DRAFT_398929 [Eremomyces bilateralis CBS 781.70]KAF1811441.1 hypothetical protein P152DRAFT_398929 [Eremomyces bilateralis CBS 781.70]